MSKPLTKVNRLEMLDLQKTRTRANQLSRGNTAETKIHTRSFAVSTSRSGIGRDSSGRLMGTGLIVNRAI